MAQPVLMCAALAVGLLLCCTVEAEAAPTTWAVDCLTKVLRGAASTGASVVRMHAARGETVSGQAVIRSDAAQGDVSAQCTELRSGSSVIPGAAVKLQWVRYIDIVRNTTGLPVDELVTVAPSSIPDPFWEPPSIALAPNAAQPLWLEIAVPRDAAPGQYAGTLKFAWPGGSASVPVELTVFAFDMPAERHQNVTNWFPFPGVGYTAAEGSPEYWDLAAKFARTMVAHRQTCFNAQLSRITTTYDRERGYVCDFAYLDRWAETFFGAGMARMELFQAGSITAPVNDPAAVIKVADLAVEVKTPGVKLTPEEKLRGVLAQLEKHIREKGWQGRVMMHIQDEPFQHCVPEYKAVAAIVHEVCPSVKVIEAMEATEFGDAIDVMVPKLSHLNLFYPYFQRAKGEGKELWFYTCCHPVGRYPNRFLDQQLVKMRALPWIQYLYGMDGYLHWGLSYQVAGLDPYSQEGISQGLPLGDCAIMFPGKDGPLGSMRMSTMRNGLQDYEYLWVLEQRVAALKKRLGAGAAWVDPRSRPLELCRRVVQSFHSHTRDGQTLLRVRREIAREIEDLDAAPLLYVQTEPAEGTTIPAGPRMAIVRGVADPGAKVTVNGERAQRIEADGTFAAFVFLERPSIEVVAEKDGKSRKIVRTFPLSD